MEYLELKNELQEKNQYIFQHNVITSGRYDYSACMLDILFMILSKLTQNQIEYLISVKEIENITGRSWNYQQLKVATQTIGSRMFEIETSDTYEQIWLFSKVKYLKSGGAFEVVLNNEVLPYFFELKNNFTSLQLKSVLNCSSKYSKRIYGLLCQWRYVGKKKFEIKELKQMLGLIDRKGKEQLERFSDFKIKVLDIAKEQINANSDISFDYELTKMGRRFHWITFYINTQIPKQLEIDFNYSDEKQNLKNYIMETFGYSEHLADFASHFSKKDFIFAQEEAMKKLQENKIKFNEVENFIFVFLQKIES